MKVETFVNKTIHYPNWDMSQTTFFFTKSKSNQKKNHNVILKKKKTQKKKKNQNTSHILTIQIILNNRDKKERILQGVLVYLWERLNLPSL